MLVRARDLEALFTRVFWDEVAPEHGLAPRTDDDDDIARLAQRIASLERVLGGWRAIERRWSVPARAVPRSRLGKALANGNARVVSLGRGVSDETAHSIATLVRPHRATLPLALAVDTSGRGRPGRGRPWVAISTTVARGAGAFQIEPEGVFSDLRKMLGTLREIELGDADFDGVFLVRGHEPTLRGTIDRRARRALLRIGELSSLPTLTLARGIATLAIGAMAPSEVLVALAVEVLLATRHAPPRALLSSDRPQIESA